MRHDVTACIFVDGENLRHSLGELFYTEFDPRDYLPKQADWAGFFDHLVGIAKADLRLRSYWYVVDDIEFYPYGAWTKDDALMENVLRKHRPFREELVRIGDPSDRLKRAKIIAAGVISDERKMARRFAGWKQFQDSIASKFDAIEFRRAGSIRYNLFTKQLGKEKEVDVYLATDLLQLRNIYDVAIIVSGDQDYCPAVRAAKDSGKQVINVSFRERGGKLLPGGARRLNRETDRTIEMNYGEVAKFMNFVTPPQFSN
jgi:uncharacterized LabA/DUF88 family protein